MTETTTSSDFSRAFSEALLGMFTEVFDEVNGYVLDKGTSFFETLDTISAEEASLPIAVGLAPLSAQVNHTRFYIDVLLDHVINGNKEKRDWDGSWQVGAVTPEEWRDLVHGLRTSYLQFRDLAEQFQDWNADAMGSAMALLAHSAYHLGEVRQGLGVLRDRQP